MKTCGFESNTSNLNPYRSSTTMERIDNTNSRQPDYIYILNTPPDSNFDGLSTTKEHHIHIQNLINLMTYLFK
jgi:hypothetical protein